MTPNPRIRTKATDTGLAAYDLSRAAPGGAPLERAAVFPVEARPRSHAAAPDLERAVYTTDDALVCVGRDGAIRWRLDFEAAPKRYMNGSAACALSLKGDVVWLYRPDLAMKGPGHTDQWLALDAATGAVLGQADLGSAGHGAEHLVHPDGEQVLLDVGEGQDGSRTYLARLDGAEIVVTEYAWDSTVFALSPDGGGVLTVRQERGGLRDELVIRSFPEGREDVVVSSEALGFDEDEHETFFIGFVVGYLDADTAIVSVRGELAEDEDWDEDEDEDEDWDEDEIPELDFHANRMVDVRTGRVLGSMPAEFLAREDVVPLGDGTWLTSGSDGEWYRHAR